MVQTAWDLLQANSIWPVLALDPSFRPQLAGLLGAEMAVDIGALERAVEALVMPMLQTAAHHTLYWLSLSCWVMAIALDHMRSVGSLSGAHRIFTPRERRGMNARERAARSPAVELAASRRLTTSDGGATEGAQTSTTSLSRCAILSSSDI